jgi:hypothetical protein
VNGTIQYLTGNCAGGGSTSPLGAVTGPTTTLTCGNGAANGLRIAFSSVAITGVQLTCTDGSTATGTIGVSPTTNLSCPSGMALSGFYGINSPSSGVTGVAIICRDAY